MSEISNVSVTSTARGLARYEIEVHHAELGQVQVFRGDNSAIVRQKAAAKARQWDEAWEKKRSIEEKRRTKEENAQDAALQTEQAKKALAELDTILSQSLRANSSIDWDSLKDHSDFPKSRPSNPILPPPPALQSIPPQPVRFDVKYQPKLGLLDHLFPSRRTLKETHAEGSFRADLAAWNRLSTAAREQLKSANEQYQANCAARELEYVDACDDWELEREDFIKKREERNASVDQQRSRFLAGEEAAVHNYFDMVLSNSKYPDFFPQSNEIEYNPNNKILIIDYQMPTIQALPTVKAVRYIASRDELEEQHISESELNRLYDSLLYQVCLRTIREVFTSDEIGALSCVVFNGFVDSVDPSTGQRANSCILSAQASKGEFSEINLANVDPKACFKRLKGVGSSKLHSLTPIAPILSMSREDKRFVQAHEVVDKLKEGDNIAAMDWEDFEHLIRELFEKEFSQNGGEVKVTQASRDGGVDAVAFDPDPIRGGKIVIQAKRYTNTVGVSAVRDLYGTVMNEGATKGILVSTADYGPDAYDFARGKPLTLLNGSNLLSLLEKHGHKARIDLREAKKILFEQE